MKNKIFVYQETGQYTREIHIPAKTEDEAYAKWRDGHPSVVEKEATFDPSGRPDFIEERPSPPRPPDPPPAPPGNRYG